MLIDLMSFKRAGLREARAALVARVRPFPRVHPRMTDQTIPNGEGLAAVVALERTLLGVRFLVRLKATE